MNELQRQKAVEALEKQKEQARKKNHSVMFRLGAYCKLHYDGVMLPYRVLYDLGKAAFAGAFREIMPNPYYPFPAITLATKRSEPIYTGNFKGLPLNEAGFPDFKADAEYQRQCAEYKQRVKSEKMSADKWAYYYARFLLPYDLSSFSFFDWWGKEPESEEERNLVDGLKAACIEAQADCRENPGEYNLEPIPRLEEHKAIYDVGYGYI